MSSLNRTVLVGRLTRDVEVRKTQSGKSYARFTVACDRSTKKDGQEQTADFISCVAWDQRADFLGRNGLKGTLVGIDGHIMTGSYTNKDGLKVYTTDVVADQIQIFESKKNQRSDYPSNGTPLRRDDINANEGFDVGMDGYPIDPNEDLPF